MYERLPREGMVHSSLMCGQRFDMSDEFDPEWSCPAVSWSAGGSETYRFACGKPVTIRTAGAITLAPGDRYAYRASELRQFRSNMIAFPRWITDGYRSHPISTGAEASRTVLETRRVRPGRYTLSLMNEVAAMCRMGERRSAGYDERLVLIYTQLMEEQAAINSAVDQLPTSRRATRKELSLRAHRARDLILSQFGNRSLSLDTIARHACLSKFHLVRVFRACFGSTPMQFAKRVRIDAAFELLRDTSMPVSDVATAVGFQNRSAFFRAFRDRYRMAPSAVRSS